MPNTPDNTGTKHFGGCNNDVTITFLKLICYRHDACSPKRVQNKKNNGANIENGEGGNLPNASSAGMAGRIGRSGGGTWAADYRTFMLTVALELGADYEDAEDLVQKVQARLFQPRGMANLRGSISFAYLSRAVFRQFLSLQRWSMAQKRQGEELSRDDEDLAMEGDVALQTQADTTLADVPVARHCLDTAVAQAAKKSQISKEVFYEIYNEILLDDRSVSQERYAEAKGMSYVTYRQTRSRIHHKIKFYFVEAVKELPTSPEDLEEEHAYLSEIAMRDAREQAMSLEAVGAGSFTELKLKAS